MGDKKYGKQVLGVTDETLRRFYAYQWPGNIRELENLLERGVILADNDQWIESRQICLGMPMPDEAYMVIGTAGQLEHSAKPDVLDEVLEQMSRKALVFEDLEKQLLEKALDQAKGNVLEAARILGISGPQCRYRLKKLALI